MSVRGAAAAIVVALLVLARPRAAAADPPSDRTLVFVGLGLALPTYVVGVVVHEGSHALTAKAAGADVVEFRLERVRGDARHRHLLRPGHLAQLRAILDDPEASANDRFVALDLLKNANIAAGGVLPMCQDTGTAIVMGKKGQHVSPAADDEEAIARGVYDTYTELEPALLAARAARHVREKSTPATTCRRRSSSTPTDGDAYKFLFMAKGGGSANKSYLFQETKALLNPKSCSPSSTRSCAASAPPRARRTTSRRDRRHERRVRAQDRQARERALPRHAADHRQRARPRLPRPRARGRGARADAQFGIGAQFGGKYFCHDVRVIRLPRHGASARSASRLVLAPTARPRARSPSRRRVPRAARDRPGALPPRAVDAHEELGGEVVKIDLNRPMARSAPSSRKYPSRRALADRAAGRRARHRPRQDQGAPRPRRGLPQYLKDHMVYYAGPAKTPEGMASGSFGPTTAGRMDSYVDQFQAAGGSFVMLAKGNRSKQVTDACKKHGGFYLGSIGGPARASRRTASRRSRCSSTPSSAWRRVEDRGRGLPRVHRRRRQGQRLLRAHRRHVLAHPRADQLRGHHPAVARGQTPLGLNNCMGCHTLLGEGAYYAPELTKVYERRGPVSSSAPCCATPGDVPGPAQDAELHFTDAQIDDLVAFLQWIGKVDLNGFPPKPTHVQVGSGRPTPRDDAAPTARRSSTRCASPATPSAAGRRGGPGARRRRHRSTPPTSSVADDPLAVKPDAKMPKLPLTDEQVIVELVAFSLRRRKRGAPSEVRDPNGRVVVLRHVHAAALACRSSTASSWASRTWATTACTTSSRSTPRARRTPTCS
jgi:fumarate hydratase class I